jgi:ABC-type antimicrobial peptide transport system permease subunit
MAPSRSLMWLFVSFAGSALILAVIGTYGVVSYATSQRTNEFGIRVALGATGKDIFSMVLGQSLRLVCGGLGLGMIAAFALTSLIRRFLYGVKPTDPLTFVAVGLLLGIVALAAGYLPARRASRIDPMAALRHE